MLNKISVLIVLLFVTTTSIAQVEESHIIRLKNNSGDFYEGELGKVKVKENRESSNSLFIEVPFFRIKTRAEKPLAPIFLLAGGPGDDPSVLEELEELGPLLYEFIGKSDLIVIEQRGNGLSKPKLSCPGSYNLPLNKPLSLSLFTKEYRKFVTGCRDYWNKKDRDLSSYNVISMVDDIEGVRKHLNYDKIMLFGGSFGSHHSLTYLKKYPKNVDRVLIDSPEGLNHTVKLPMNVDSILYKLSDLVKENKILNRKIPSFIKLVKDQLNTLGSSPVRVKVNHPKTNKEVEIVIGKYDLQLVTALKLGRRHYRELPYRYLQMKKGDYSWLAEEAIDIRVNQGESLMATLTDCSSGATKKRWMQVRNETNKAILGDALNNIIFTACDLLPNKELANELNVGFYTNVPILIIYGTQDARTPPQNVKDIVKYFSNYKTLTVKHGSHDLFKEVLEQLMPIMVKFLTTSIPIKVDLPSNIIAPITLRVK